MIVNSTHPLFALGRLMTTPAALDVITQSDIVRAIGRHAIGEWGDVCPEDKQANDDALKTGGRLFSVYNAVNGTKFWVITEADRSTTTVLLPGDY